MQLQREISSAAKNETSAIWGIKNKHSVKVMRWMQTDSKIDNFILSKLGGDINSCYNLESIHHQRYIFYSFHSRIFLTTKWLKIKRALLEDFHSWFNLHPPCFSSYQLINGIFPFVYLFFFLDDKILSRCKGNLKCAWVIYMHLMLGCKVKVMVIKFVCIECNWFGCFDCRTRMIL